MPALTSPIARRLEVCLHRWPRPLARDLRQYLAAAPGWPQSRPRDGAGRHHEHCWLLLPRWLFARYSRAPARPRRGFLGDVLWGQYCLFLFVRIHDDVFDGHATQTSLVFAADALLVESERAFARHFDAGPFWSLFRRYLDTSLRAIVEVDAHQRGPNGMRRADLALYARVSAIFKTGAAAVCVRCRRLADLPSVERFIDGVAVASQILDDLVDTTDDLRRGRLNVAAAALFRSRAGLGAGRAQLVRQVARRARVEAALDRLFAEAATHLQGARAAADALGLVEAAHYAESFERSLVKLDDRLHRSRVKDLLGR